MSNSPWFATLVQKIERQWGKFDSKSKEKRYGQWLADEEGHNIEWQFTNKLPKKEWEQLKDQLKDRMEDAKSDYNAIMDHKLYGKVVKS
jgi:hypothetical protein